MTDELNEQQVIQDMNTKRVDRILYIDKISGIEITIEMYQVYNEEECFYKYNNKKLNKKNIEKLQNQYLSPLNEEHIEKLKEEQVARSLANKRKQAKCISELKIDDDDKFYTVTKIKFHKLKLQDMINRLNSGEIRLLEDPKDRSIEEIWVRKKQDKKLAQEHVELKKKGIALGILLREVIVWMNTTKIVIQCMI